MNNNMDLFSEDIRTVGQALTRLIEADRESEKKKKARTGIAYYDGKHEILDYKIYYIDSNGRVQEEGNRSNIKIQHQFHTELVDQKVQYLLGKPPLITVDDNEPFQKELDAYFKEEFHENLQDVLLGASNKGHEFIYGYKRNDGLMGFTVADMLGVIEIYEEGSGNKRLAVIRYYKDIIADKKGKPIEVTKAEIWTNKATTYYVKEGKTYELDEAVDINPRPHILYDMEDGYYTDDTPMDIPFFKVQNNIGEKSDLEPIKTLIDDYDLMACSLSNNLQDFQEAIYVVKGFKGASLDELVQNLKTRKTIGVSEDGDLDIKTVEIPVDSRKMKLELDKEAIYKFGMGFDSTQVGDGNITNIVLKARYSLLELKANKSEIRLKKALRQIIKLVTEDINQRLGKSYDYNSVEIEFEREMMVNEDSLTANRKVEEEIKKQAIENVLMANMLSEETRLRLICEILELDYDEEQAKIDEYLDSMTMVPVTPPPLPPEEDDEEEDVID